MGGLIVFLVIVVLSAVIGGVSQWLKNAQQAEQARAARGRAADRAASARLDDDRPAGKPASNDLDRFLAEIDKLRRRAEAGGDRPAVVAPAARRPAPDVPVVAPTRKARRVEPPAFAAPPPPRAARPAPMTPPLPPTPPRLEDLPVAPVLPGPAAMAGPAAAPAVTRREPVRTEFGRQLAGLLGSRQSVPMAVVLQEVLGPPKCRRGQ